MDYQMITRQDTDVTPQPRRQRRRWPWIAAAAVTAAGAGTAAALLMLPPASHGPSHACQRATAAQNRFVGEAVALGYPNVDIATALAIMSHDLELMKNMTTAGCAGNTLIDTLPGS